METGEIAVVKTLNNLQSNIVLVNELVSYKIALLLGLPVPESGICLIDENTEGIEKLESNDKLGKGFYSKRIDNATVVNSSKMIDLVENKKDIIKVIVFDHLIYNSDRNQGNIIISFKKKKVLLNVIDHTHVFNKECLWNKQELERCKIENDFLDYRILKENSFLYTMFFERVTITLEELLTVSKEYKELINEQKLKAILKNIPKEWELIEEDANALVEYLLYRLDKLDEMCKIIFKYKQGEVE